MATHHEVQDNLWIGILLNMDKDTDILHNYHHEDMDSFENAEQENHTNLAIITGDLDGLCCRVQLMKVNPQRP